MTRTRELQRAAPPPPETGKMNERIADRRRAVREDERRRTVAGLVALGGGLAVAVVAAALLLSPLVGVRRVEVRGARETEPAEIVAVSGVRKGESFLRVGTRRAARSVETLPWVEKAQVTRALPGTVRIRVTERRAVAVGAVGEEAALVDAGGRVLRVLPPGAPRPPLAVISGSVPLAAPGSAWRDPGARETLAAATDLPGALLGRATEIRLVAGRLTAILEGGTEVVFGSAADLERKGKVALAVLAEAESRHVRPGKVDVTSPTAPAMHT